MNRIEIGERLAAAHGWEAKNRLLVQLARELPAFNETDRTEANRVAGCESRVWLKLGWHENRLDIAADSDSRVIKGLLALVLAAFQQQSPEEIATFDFENWLQEMGLARFLSASRGNGLRAIVNRVRTSSPH
jgi:cysteine desulfuration protein SufE